MIEVRPFETLGAANHGWLDAHHHFSFADYYEPARMGWGAIRVWNDDVIAPQSGFRRIRTATWRSSPMSVQGRSPMKTAWAIAAAPRRARGNEWGRLGRCVMSF